MPSGEPEELPEELLVVVIGQTLDEIPDGVPGRQGRPPTRPPAVAWSAKVSTALVNASAPRVRLCWRVRDHPFNDVGRSRVW